MSSVNNEAGLLLRFLVKLALKEKRHTQSQYLLRKQPNPEEPHLDLYLSGREPRRRQALKRDSRMRDLSCWIGSCMECGLQQHHGGLGTVFRIRYILLSSK